MTTATFAKDLDRWVAHVDVRFDSACPVWREGLRREARFSFTPDGEQPLPPATAGISISGTPSLWGRRNTPPPRVAPTPAPTPAPAPTPTQPPSPPAAAYEEGGWIVIPALAARVQAPGARVTPARQPVLGAFDSHIVGTSDDCRVGIARWPTLAATGPSTRARLIANGNSLTVDRVGPDRWHLEYEANSFLYVSVGQVVGEWAVICRADYPTGQERNLACAAAICSSLLMDPRPPW